jgi:hypothetical protein
MGEKSEITGSVVFSRGSPLVRLIRSEGREVNER